MRMRAYYQTNNDINGIDPEATYIWELGGDNPCPICVKWSEIGPQKGQFWIENAIPRTPGNYPYGPYGTYCEANCMCNLIKV